MSSAPGPGAISTRTIERTAPRHAPSELAVVVAADLFELRAMRRVLEDLDFRVVTLSAPSAALAMTLARRVDVVVYDVATPGGRELAQKIRASPAHPGPALVALAASTDALERVTPADVVLTKPVGVAELVDGVERALARSRARRAPLDPEPIAG
jgi:CheY-like chemotaxis protein